MTTPREQIKQIQAAKFGTLNDFSGSDGDFAVTNTEVKKLHRRVITCAITDAGGAGDNASERVIFTADNGPVRVISAYISAPVTAAGHAANNVLFTLAKRTAGGAATTIATRETTVVLGGLVAFTPSPMVLVAAAVDLLINDALTLKAIKAGAGVAFAAPLDAKAEVSITIEEI